MDVRISLRRRAAVAVAVVALAGACGGDDDSHSNEPGQQTQSSTSMVDEDEFAAKEQTRAGAVPNADELAAALLVSGDLGTWPGLVELGEVSGVVTDEIRDSLPGWELCPSASEEAQAVADGLEWDAFMQRGLASEDSSLPPDEHTEHTIWLQQYLTTTDPADAAETFDLLDQGAKSCQLALEETSDEGQRYSAERIDDIDLGDDSLAALTTSFDGRYESVEIPISEVAVRKGPVLMLLVVSDIRADESVEPHFSTDAIVNIAETAVDKL